jgi:hypothetical protein
LAEFEKFLCTGDDYFDGWANGLYIRLDIEKRESGKSFIDFISPLYEFHIYLKINMKRTISCVEKIKDLVNSAELDLTDTLFFIDQILEFYKIHPINNGGLIAMVLLQIQYYRNSIDNTTLIQGLEIDEEILSETNYVVKQKIKQDISKPSQIQFALYYYYLQVAKIYPWFEGSDKTKTELIKEIANKYEISPKAFQQRYNSISQYSTNRIALNQLKNIIRVIEMLKTDGYTEAVAEAEKELKLIESKL